MRRLTAILVGLAVVAAVVLLVRIADQGFAELAAAEREQDRLEAQRERLTHSIAELHDTLEAVRDDPAAVESLARDELGYIRPGERVILLATPTPAPTPSPLTAEDAVPILAIPE